MKPLYQRMPRPQHDPEFAARAKALSRAMLELHKELLDAVRVEYEATNGPQAPLQMWNLLVSDPFFAWLRPLSGMVARLDELLASETDRAPYRQMLGELEHMIGSGDPAHQFAGSYARYLQSPEIISAHASVRSAVARFEPLVKE
ncbi:MAG: hypothetical protein ABR517_11095 [Thermoanaerobaculia bacterium]